MFVWLEHFRIRYSDFVSMRVRRIQFKTTRPNFKVVGVFSMADILVKRYHIIFIMKPIIYLYCYIMTIIQGFYYIDLLSACVLFNCVECYFSNPFSHPLFSQIIQIVCCWLRVQNAKGSIHYGELYIDFVIDQLKCSYLH